jgi:hypothetical protein
MADKHKNNGWKSPKEKIPNHKDWVLFQIEDDPYYVTGMFYDGEDSNEKPHFFWPNNFGGENYDLDEVIAWKYPNE